MMCIVIICILSRKHSSDSNCCLDLTFSVFFSAARSQMPKCFKKKIAVVALIVSAYRLSWKLVGKACS